MTPELRAALWRDCGLIRDAAGLAHLLDAPHLLTRLIAESALTREESRGSHFRVGLPVRERRRSSGTSSSDPAPQPGARDMAVATDTLERIVHAALAEDIGAGDVTTEATVAADAVGTAELLVKEPGVVCGLRAAEATFRALDPDLRFEALASDGDVVEAAGRRRSRDRARSARSSPESASR